MKPIDGSRNKYIENLVTNLNQQKIDVRSVSLKNLAINRGEIIHIHWPDSFFRSSNLIISYLKLLSLLIFFLFCKINKHKVIWTVHNLKPHANGSGFRWSLFKKVIKKNIQRFILLNKYSQHEFIRVFDVNPNKVQITRHYLYKPTVKIIKSRKNNLGCELLYFGILDFYKGLLETISEFAQHQKSGLRLKIIGEPINEEFKNALISATENIDNIELDIGFCEENKLQIEILSCDYVFLPYKNITNSGALLYALSMGKTVITTKNGLTEELQFDFGPDRIKTFKQGNKKCLRECLKGILKMKSKVTSREIVIPTSYSDHSITQEHITAYSKVLQK